MNHRIVPVSVDPFNEPEDDARYRCEGCKARAYYADDDVFDGDCPASPLPFPEAAA